MERPEQGRLFVVSGPSGAGKSTVIKEFARLKPDAEISVSCTTRPARPGERSGIDYAFISEQDFLAMRDRGEFLESAVVYGNLYGTPRTPVERARAQGKDVILEVDIQGAVSVKRSMPDAVLVFIEPPSIDDLSGRLRGRGSEDPESLGVRMRASYEELKAKGAYDHVIVNDDVRQAALELVRILEAQNHTKGSSNP
jgi:guanylate kinase